MQLIPVFNTQQQAMICQQAVSEESRLLTSDEAIAVGVLFNLFTSNSLLQSKPSPNYIEGGKERSQENCMKVWHGVQLSSPILHTILKIGSVCPPLVKDHFGLDTLHELVHSICVKRIHPSSVQSMVVDVLNLMAKGSSKEIDKDLRFKTEITFHAAAVYFYYISNSASHEDLVNDDLFLDYGHYPLFSEELIDNVEAQYLITFRRMMRMAASFIPPRRNKMLLIGICGLLEGSGRVYVSGGTQSAATSRRMIIYEQETGSSAKDEAHLKRMITCSCGAVILKRTMWKHSQTKKHHAYLQQTKQYLPIPDMTPRSSLSSDDQIDDQSQP